MTGEELERAIKEIWELFKETDRKFKETDREIKALKELFTGQWGKLMEAMVEPSVVRLFQQWGIKVEGVAQNVRKSRNGSSIEIDLLITNAEDVVVVEVKTTVKVEDVREHIERLERFKEFFPEYRSYRVYGAVAGLRYEEDSDRYAYRQGLFVLKSTEGIVRISNDKEFKPRIW